MRHIRSSAVKLAYSDAQEVIEGRPLPEFKIVAKDGRDGVEKDIKMMAVRSSLLRRYSHYTDCSLALYRISLDRFELVDSRRVR